MFGAVALVGVVGVATSTLMRGPVGTVVRLNQNAKADAQMQIAHKLAMLEAAKAADSGDCDSDGFVEPLGFVACATAPGGGGCIPPSIGTSQNDPWGTTYGYCSWDHGPMIGSGCAPTNGANVLDGTNGSSETVIAIISAGQDRVFQTTCADDPGYVTRGGDDLVIDITYAGAVEASGGLWALKSGSPDTATIDKNVEVPEGNQVAFKSGGSLSGGAFDMTDSRLQFGANSMLDLPDQDTPGSRGGGVSVPEECLGNAANAGALRVNFTSGTVLDVCDTVSGWTEVGGAGSSAGAQGVDGSVQMSDGTGSFKDDGGNFNYAAGVLSVPDATLTGTLTSNDVDTATITDSGDGILDITGDLDVSGDIDGTDITASGTASGGTVSAGAGGLDSTGGLDVTAGTTNLLITDVQGAFSVGAFATTLGGTLTVAGDITDSDGAVTFSDADGVDITSGNLDVTNNVNVSGNADVTGDVFGNSFQDVNDAGGGAEGLFFSSTGNVQLRTDGNTRLESDQAGNIFIPGDLGINIASGVPTAALDIDGEIRLRSSAAYTAGNACSEAGMIAYSGSDELMICSDNTGLWETVGTSGGGGGGVGGVWTDEGTYIRYENYSYITSSGTDLTFSSALEGAGTRMLWYTSAAAFRAGQVTGSQWDDGVVGAYSTAFGLDTVASGQSAFAIGEEAEARAAQAIAMGNKVYVEPGATNSMGLGLGAPVGNAPQVFGTNSLGIFMGDQTDVDFLANSTMGLFGGRMVIDPNAAATELAVSGVLDLDVEGEIGAIQYCDEDGGNCFTAEAVATGSVGVPGADTEVLFNSGGSLGSDPGFVFISASNRLGLGVTAPNAQLELAEQLLLGNVNDCTANTQGALRLNAVGDVLEMCDFAGSGGYVAIGGATVAAPGSDRQIIFNSAGALDAATDFVYTSAGDFIVGSYQLD
ncbi:MAG: hypothetical protein H6869_08375, partial [Rhodospirillales bacterium]|nr:hypothetical protein [Rhodospirillales bacterium]